MTVIFRLHQQHRHHSVISQLLKDRLPELDPHHHAQTVAYEVLIPYGEKESTTRCAAIWSYVASSVDESTRSAVTVAIAVVQEEVAGRLVPTGHFYFSCDASKERKVRQEIKQRFPDALLVPFALEDFNRVLEAEAATHPFRSYREIIEEHLPRPGQPAGSRD